MFARAETMEISTNAGYSVQCTVHGAWCTVHSAQCTPTFDNSKTLILHIHFNGAHSLQIHK